MNFAGFDRPKVRKKKILCLYSPSLKVYGTKTSGPLRFSELGKQRASQNSVYLTREACSKNMICTVKLEDLDSLSLNYRLKKFVQEVANKNGGRHSYVLLLLIDIQTHVFRYPNTRVVDIQKRCFLPRYQGASM